MAVGYEPRAANTTVLHRVVREHLDAFLAAAAARTDGAGVPSFIYVNLFGATVRPIGQARSSP